MRAIKIAEKYSHVASKESEAVPLLKINIKKKFIILIFQVFEHILRNMLFNNF